MRTSGVLVGQYRMQSDESVRIAARAGPCEAGPTGGLVTDGTRSIGGWWPSRKARHSPRRFGAYRKPSTISERAHTTTDPSAVAAASIVTG